jgi:octaheme c-type cytochrome (tetrathionate reductase family)
MRRSAQKTRSFTTLINVVLLAFALTGCEDGKDGDDGFNGADGADGLDGATGVSCWDLNQDGLPDPAEDLNGDGTVDVLDCNALASGAYEVEQLHIGYFTDNAYQGTQSCLDCHGLIGDEMLTNAHFKWEGTSTNITGYEGETHGKNDLINNFCIAVPSNEGRCTQCHAGYGYDDDTFSFADRESVDCLVCHDQSGTYAKDLTTAGLPVDTVDLQVVARSVAQNDGQPTIKNCIDCHAKAGGGDNVKHGDLAMSLVDTTREYDVHMGKDGLPKYDCVDCHASKKSGDELIDHGIGGMAYHSVDDGDMQDCVDCHGDRANIHAGKTVEPILNLQVDGVVAHDKLACQVCHIPAIARGVAPTMVEWYWGEAGLDEAPPLADGETYSKKKGRLVWANNVRPALLYHDGMWNRKMIGVNDEFTSTPVDLGTPSADFTTPGAMIYPFKKMIGNQPADADPLARRMLVPHLFGGKGGPNPYWAKYDWNLALQDGADYTNQTYSGEYEFVDTFMFLKVDHEVAPAEHAFGMDNNCVDCHAIDVIDWTLLGWTDNPTLGGERIEP